MQSSMNRGAPRHMKMLCSHRAFSVTPFQGSGQLDHLFPGLTPWALLLHPFGVFTVVKCIAPQGFRRGEILSPERAGQHSPGRKPWVEIRKSQALKGRHRNRRVDRHRNWSYFRSGPSCAGAHPVTHEKVMPLWSAVVGIGIAVAIAIGFRRLARPIAMAIATPIPIPIPTLLAFCFYFRSRGCWGRSDPFCF